MIKKWYGRVLMGQVSPQNPTKGQDSWKGRWAIKEGEEQQGRGLRKIDSKTRRRESK